MLALVLLPHAEFARAPALSRAVPMERLRRLRAFGARVLASGAGRWIAPALAALCAALFALTALLGAGADPLLALFAAAALGACPFLLCAAMRERRALRDAARRDRAAAEAAARANEAKSHFLAAMSHELRTPLNAVIGYAEMLEEDLQAGVAPDPEDARRVADSARTLLALINDVLDLSKIEAGRLEVRRAETCVRELVRGAVETCRPMALANGNRIEIAADPTLAALRTDPLRLRQCVLNLLSNACKFTQGGLITVRVARVRGAAGPMLQISVADTGIGIPLAEQGRLFQPFAQAHAAGARAYGGTGLGLSITRKLCQLLGGEVSLVSVEGEGTTVSLTLPIEEAAPEALAA